MFASAAALASLIKIFKCPDVKTCGGPLALIAATLLWAPGTALILAERREKSGLGEGG